MVRSAFHPTFPTFWHGGTVQSMIFVVTHGHVIYFGQWNVSRNNVRYFQADIERASEQSVMAVSPSSIAISNIPGGVCFIGEVLKWQLHEAEPPVPTQWTCVVWERNGTHWDLGVFVSIAYSSLTGSAFYQGKGVLRPSGRMRERCVYYSYNISIPSVSHSLVLGTEAYLLWVLLSLRRFSALFLQSPQQGHSFNWGRQVTWMNKQANVFTSNTY